MFLLTGCSVYVKSNEDIDTTIAKLTQQIEELRLQLGTLKINEVKLNQQVKELISLRDSISQDYQEIYDLRNDLDMLARKFFIAYATGTSTF